MDRSLVVFFLKGDAPFIYKTGEISCTLGSEMLLGLLKVILLIKDSSLELSPLLLEMCVFETVAQLECLFEGSYLEETLCLVV